MNKKLGKITTMLFVVITMMCVSLNAYAHSGRTDSSGGHRDNKNKSGLGSYHYHCGGHPAHLHKNGVCPYTSKSKKSSSSSKSNSSSKSYSTKTVSAEPVTIKATSIEINEDIENIYVGETQILTATILPNNVTNKQVTWKSSNEDIATISSSGKIIANKDGSVTITASTSNGKKDTLKINIVEKVKENKEQNIIEINELKNDITTDSNINNINSLNNTVETSEESDAAGGLITLGALGGGYWVYRRRKKSKE